MSRLLETTLWSELNYAATNMQWWQAEFPAMVDEEESEGRCKAQAVNILTVCPGVLSSKQWMSTSLYDKAVGWGKWQGRGKTENGY